MRHQRAGDPPRPCEIDARLRQSCGAFDQLDRDRDATDREHRAIAARERAALDIRVHAGGDPQHAAALRPLDERKAGQPDDGEIDLAAVADPIGPGGEVADVEDSVPEPNRDLGDLHVSIDTSRWSRFLRNRSNSPLSISQAVSSRP
jgi:hypothetical protein